MVVPNYAPPKTNVALPRKLQLNLKEGVMEKVLFGLPAVNSGKLCKTTSVTIEEQWAATTIRLANIDE